MMHDGFLVKAVKMAKLLQIDFTIVEANL